MTRQEAALHNARHYLRLALASLDGALEDRDAKPENILGQTPGDDAHELVRLQELARGAGGLSLPATTRQAVVEACARGDYAGARQLLGEIGEG